MKIIVCDSDEGGGNSQANINFGMTVADYFRQEKSGLPMKNYTVLLNGRTVSDNGFESLSENSLLSISKKKMVGAFFRRIGSGIKSVFAAL